MKLKKIGILIGLLVMFTNISAKIVTIEFKVAGQCGECQERIEEALDLPGITYAKWDVESKILTVRFKEKKFSVDDIHKIVSELGYATDKLEANKTAEKELPRCCQPGGH